ncbi:hypothetical protein Zmor_026096 [Zophobas morio]|uniref:Uncharacterized protein n=1 Tax=Zophobas morio TaxID=2755281 RepID=A0AA38HUN4_9CUCU|nr:hypothetical protein Zmor_026096 [Zophobas morio]
MTHAALPRSEAFHVTHAALPRSEAFHVGNVVSCVVVMAEVERRIDYYTNGEREISDNPQFRKKARFLTLSALCLSPSIKPCVVVAPSCPKPPPSRTRKCINLALTLALCDHNGVATHPQIAAGPPNHHHTNMINS